MNNSKTLLIASLLAAIGVGAGCSATTSRSSGQSAFPPSSTATPLVADEQHAEVGTSASPSTLQGNAGPGMQSSSTGTHRDGPNTQTLLLSAANQDLDLSALAPNEPFDYAAALSQGGYDESVLGARLDSYLQSCMAGRGFQYVSSRVESPEQWFSVADYLRNRQTYGYGFTRAIERGRRDADERTPPENPDYWEALVGDRGAMAEATEISPYDSVNQWGGCAKKALERLGEIRPELTPQQYDALVPGPDDIPDLTQYLAAWSACMATGGYNFVGVLEPEREALRVSQDETRTIESRRSQELALAERDAACYLLHVQPALNAVVKQRVLDLLEANPELADQLFVFAEVD